MCIFIDVERIKLSSFYCIGLWEGEIRVHFRRRYGTQRTEEGCLIYMIWCTMKNQILWTFEEKNLFCNNWCRMCKECCEEADHVILRCILTSELCTFVTWHSLIAVQALMSRRIRRLCKEEEVARVNLTCLFWTNWKERNWRIFRGRTYHQKKKISGRKKEPKEHKELAPFPFIFLVYG